MRKTLVKLTLGLLKISVFVHHHRLEEVNKSNYPFPFTRELLDRPKGNILMIIMEERCLNG